MKAAYFILASTSNAEVVLDHICKELGESKTSFFDGACLNIRSEEGEFLSMIEESEETLLDEWEADDPIFNLLLKNRRFSRSSKALYLTMSHQLKESPLLKLVISVLVRCKVDFLVFDCEKTVLEGKNFLPR